MASSNINMAQVEAQVKKIGETHLNAKIQMLEELLEEMQTEGYETFSQLKGSIDNNLEILIKLKTKEGEK